jgi:hypothetical protein
MAGPPEGRDPAIHLVQAARKNVDARVKPAQDDGGVSTVRGSATQCGVAAFVE